VFDAKYHYNFWRPITAIRNGDIDGNPATDREATWQPIDNTPMHPEYPCAHCILSGTVAGVIKTMLGGEDIPELAMTSTTAPGVTHRWANLYGVHRRSSECSNLGWFPLPEFDSRRDGHGTSNWGICRYCQGSIVRFGNWRRQIFLDSGILFRFKDS
jgi:hypothetical protein